MPLFLRLLIAFVVVFEVIHCHPSIEPHRIRRQSEDENENLEDIL